ncbi:D-glycerate dehydrogenase [Caldilinea sp.]|jgi:glyoxylate reductase|uniref:2-hydroxyacid dehydrogenase n=1 Tax=Caldilinea sp. TaxID=2293560 RepID=UPI00257F56D3|nr:D-glycerate dehydrogenase [Caldilinea sp.]
MNKPKVFVTRMIPDRGLRKVLEQTDATVWQEELPPPRQVLLEWARQADGLLTLLTDRIDAELLDAAPRLKVVANLAVGYDNFDVAAATRRGVLMTNTPGVLTETTADFAFALMMACARRIVEGRDYAKNGHWRTWGPMLLLGQDVYGATLGIVGLGRIGMAVARRARGFNMRILYHSSRRNEAAEKELGAIPVSKEELLSQADFISLHVPLTPETRHYIDADALRLMKPNAVLVNTARGAVVDTMALYEALKARQIFAAGLDVTDPEPLPADHPLYTLDNALIVPHIASASFETRSRMAEIAADNLLAGLEGRLPPNCLNPEAFRPLNQGASI